MSLPSGTEGSVSPTRLGVHCGEELCVFPPSDWEHPESENHPSFPPCVESLGVGRVDKLLRESLPYCPAPDSKFLAPLQASLDPQGTSGPVPAPAPWNFPLQLHHLGHLVLGWVSPPSQGKEGAGLDWRPVGSLSKA